MLKVLGTLAAAVAGVVIYSSRFPPSGPNLEQQINKKEACAACNRPLKQDKITLGCRRHAVHKECHQTLINEGQSKCPVCPGHFETKFQL